MMIIYENIELYRYEIHALVKAFFPEQTVKVLVGDPAEQDRRKFPEDPFMFVDFTADRIEARVPTKEICEQISAPTGISFAQKGSACKDECKHLLYRVLSLYTGVELPWGELIGIRPTKIAMTRLRAGDSLQQAAYFMEKEYRVSPQKAELAAQIADRERKILADIHYQDGYSLYVGIPFCPTTCLYCSFTSFPIASWSKRVDEYLDALEKEMEAGSRTMEGRILDTVYIGGGTPTTLEPLQLERLIGMLKKYFHIDRLMEEGKLQEFTVEAGRPDSITLDKLKVLKESGVTRISVNPQTMRDETLKLIGRRHNVQQTVDAFLLAREAGFDNINMDIILGLPGETEDDVKYTIEKIMELNPDSLTVHSLAIKRASRLQKWIEEKGLSSINNTDAMMQIAADGASKMGMSPYYLYRQKNMSGNFENVGYARDGKAGIYNILIMEEKQSILALGAGSISKVVFENGRIERSDNCKDVATYISNTDEMIARKQNLFCQ